MWIQILFILSPTVVVIPTDQETGLGHSPDVALSLTDRCKLKKGLQ